MSRPIYNKHLRSRGQRSWSHRDARMVKVC